MNRSNTMRAVRWLGLLLLPLQLGACAGYRAYHHGISQIDNGSYAAGLDDLRRAVAAEPDNARYRQALLQQQERIAARLVRDAQSALLRGDLKAAETAMQAAQAVAPTNDSVRALTAQLSRAQGEQSQLKAIEQLLAANKASEAEPALRRLLKDNPQHTRARQLLRAIEQRNDALSDEPPALAAKLRRPVTLEFRDASLRQIFDLLSAQFGINFVFDRDVKFDQRASINVRDTSIDDALRFLLQSNQLERKVLSENSLLIYPSTAQKLKDYQDLITKSFIVSNADVKQTANLVKTMAKVREVFVDEKENLLVVRDTLETVRVAERLIASHNRARPEVMLEVEVLEVGSNDLSEIGIRWPDALSFSINGAGGAGVLSWDELKNPSSGMVQATIANPALVANLRSTAGTANILANPKIRVRNKEKAKILIGDKVPVITTTTTSTGVISESVSYLDVGIKVDVQPEVYLDDEVGIKINLEVSNIAREVATRSGSLTYQVGTRSAETLLQLRDGETQILAGLINDEDRRSVAKVPLLGDLPVLGRLFGSRNVSQSRSEVVLLITPRILRGYVSAALPTQDEFFSGTDSQAGLRPLRLNPIATDVAATAPAKPLSNTLEPMKANAAPYLIARRVGNAVAGQAVQIAIDSSAPINAKQLSFSWTYDPTRLTMIDGATLPAGWSVRTDAALGRAQFSWQASDAAASLQGNLLSFAMKLSDDATGGVTARIESATAIDATAQALPLPSSAPLLLPVEAR